MERDEKDSLKEQQREIKRKINAAVREIEKNETKTAQLKKASNAKLEAQLTKEKPDKYALNTYAKQVVTCEKRVNKLANDRYKLRGLQGSIMNYIGEQKAILAMKKATSVMQKLGEKVDHQEIQANLNLAQREMLRMGLFDEMIAEQLDNSEVEEEASELVEQLIANKHKEVKVKLEQQKEKAAKEQFLHMI